MALVDVRPDAPLSDRLQELLAALSAADQAGYIGEPVSQLAHALQAAAAGSGDEELALAALLHDIGHLADPSAPAMDVLGTADHEQLGHDVLLRLGFSPRVAALVRGHVDAKRYLARRPGYAAKLSPASLGTLVHQGGPMDDSEAAAFEADPLHGDILRLRAWDEAAKDPDADVPPLAHWAPRIEAHLRANEERAVLGCLDRPLTDAELAVWRRDHKLVLPDVFTGAALDALRAWTADLEARPEAPGKWMKYFEAGASAGRQLCRVEDFLPYHGGFAELLAGPGILRWLGQLLGEPAVLFKEKINFKLPGGSGFTAHQDAPAFTTFGQTFHVTMLIAIDPSDRSNGGLEFSDPVPLYETLPQRADGSIAPDVEAQLPWYPLDLTAGSVAFFDSYIPHRSDVNGSHEPRRGLYITYNRAADGERRADYFADKRTTFPPECEREPGVVYEAGRYNVGNPIR